MSEYEAIQAQIAELQRKAASIRAAERAAALTKIKSLMVTFDIRVPELSGTVSSSVAAPMPSRRRAEPQVAISRS